MAWDIHWSEHQHPWKITLIPDRILAKWRPCPTVGNLDILQWKILWTIPASLAWCPRRITALFQVKSLITWSCTSPCPYRSVFCQETICKKINKTMDVYRQTWKLNNKTTTISFWCLMLHLLYSYRVKFKYSFLGVVLKELRPHPRGLMG